MNWTVKTTESGLIFIMSDDGTPIANMNESLPDAAELAQFIVKAVKQAKAQS